MSARAFGPLVLTPFPEGYRIGGNLEAPWIRAAVTSRRHVAPLGPIRYVTRGA